MTFELKEDVPKNQKVKFKPNSQKSTDKTWVIKTVVITFTLSVVFNLMSSGIMELVSVWVAVLILAAIILTGILFDIVGVAVTTAQEAPFHSMASRRIGSAKCAIRLIKERDKVSNFCNDVVGDICGIISGSASAGVVAYIIKSAPNVNGFLLGIFVTALVAALTVGGKAIGKTVAIRYSNFIVFVTARVLSFVNLWKK